MSELNAYLSQIRLINRNRKVCLSLATVSHYATAVQCYSSYGFSVTVTVNINCFKIFLVTVTVAGFLVTVTFTISVTNNQRKNIFGTHNNIFSAESNI